MWYAQELRRRGAQPPVKLYVSAARAPHLAAVQHDVDASPELHILPFDDFWNAFERRYGRIPELVSADAGAASGEGFAHLDFCVSTGP